MIKPYAGAKAETYSPKEQLPAGLYIAKCIGAKVDHVKDFDNLIIQVEITNGEYAGFYKRQYEAAQGGQYEARYRGTYRVRIPKNGDERWVTSRFNRQIIGAFEDSNPQFHWDWEESHLKGLAIGLNVRNSSYNGNAFTEIGALESVEGIRSGKVKPMADRPGRSDAAEPSAPVAVNVPEEELPF